MNIVPRHDRGGHAVPFTGKRETQLLKLTADRPFADPDKGRPALGDAKDATGAGPAGSIGNHAARMAMWSPLYVE
jgi:hypothetical protein